jgi:hypothetical protein
MTDAHGVEVAAAPGQTGRWEDYIDVIFSPAELFRRRAGDRVAPPLITLLVLAVLFYFIMLPANGMAMRAATTANPDAAGAIERFGMLFQVLGSILIPITYLFVIAVAALLLLGVGRMADVPTTLSRTMLVATYAAFIYLVAQLAGGVSILIHGESGLDVIRHTSFGVLRFVGDADMNPVTMALLRRLDVFAIWQAVLWGIGVAIVFGASRAQAAATAGVTWLLAALPGIAGAAFGLGAGGTGG